MPVTGSSEDRPGDSWRREYYVAHKRFVWSLSATGYGLFCLLVPRYLPESIFSTLVLLNHLGAWLLTTAGMIATMGFFFERRKALRIWLEIIKAGLSQGEAPTQKTLPLSQSEVQEIVNAYGQATSSKRGVACDASELPYPKALIRQALIAAIRLTPPGSAREQLRSGFVALADWQEPGQPHAGAALVAESKALLAELRSLGL